MIDDGNVAGPAELLQCARTMESGTFKERWIFLYGARTSFVGHGDTGVWEVRE